MTQPRIALGTSSFRNLREEGCWYADKTPALCELLDSGAQVILMPRPRRFGKTLFMSMCEEFFAGDPQLFDGLAIREHEHWQHQGRHAVIALSFKDAKALSWEDAEVALIAEFQLRINALRPQIEQADLNPRELELLDALTDLHAPLNMFAKLPVLLSEWLTRATGEKVVILIDEYDAPLHAAWHGGYYEEMVAFLRSFLSSACKDNPHLYKGLLTGIMRVARESIFSGLNNLIVHGIDSRTLRTACGFIQEEVDQLLDAAGMMDRSQEVTDWYNGYCFAGTVIYNPWSVLSAVYHGEEPCRAWWANTSSNDLIEKCMIGEGGTGEMRSELDALLHGESIIKPVSDTLVLRDLSSSDQQVWTLLYHGGYLTADGEAAGRMRPLRLPNEEVRTIFEDFVRRWFERRVRSDKLGELAESMQAGDLELLEELIEELIGSVLSYHDTAQNPEQVYHALFLGLLVWLTPWYTIRSNRESGQGRYDLALTPRQGGPGYIIEFKRARARRGETLDAMAVDAMAQIHSRDYASELRAAGCEEIVAIAIAFQGKDYLLRHEALGGRSRVR